MDSMANCSRGFFAKPEAGQAQCFLDEICSRSLERVKVTTNILDRPRQSVTALNDMTASDWVSEASLTCPSHFDGLLTSTDAPHHEWLVVLERVCTDTGNHKMAPQW